MGGYFSSDKHYKVQPYTNPIIELAPTQKFSLRLQPRYNEKEKCYTFTLASKNVFKDLLNEVQENQRAILTCLRLLHFSNECSTELIVEIHNFFEWHEDIVRNQEPSHPDNTNLIRIVCPANKDCVLDPLDQVKYQPQLEFSKLQKYAGTEKAFQQQQNENENDNNIITTYKQLSPIVEFITDYKDELEPTKNDWKEIKDEQETSYDISDDLLNKARLLYRSYVYNKIRYTRFKDTKVIVKMPDKLNEELIERFGRKPHADIPQLTVLLSLQYIIVDENQLIME